MNRIVLLFICLTSFLSANESHFRLNFEEGDLPSLHPHVLQGHARGRVLALLLYEGLTGVNEEGHVFLKHAKNITVSEDQKTYTIELNPRQWSDGTPVTAYDYERSWKEAIAPHAPADYADLLYVIKNAKEIKNGNLALEKVGIEVIDESTMRVELEYAAPYFLKLLSQPMFSPLSEKEGVYNGPFVVSEYKNNEKLVVSKNKTFWNANEIELSTISISFINDFNKVLELYETNQMDFIGEPITRLSNEALYAFQQKGQVNGECKPNCVNS